MKALPKTSGANRRFVDEMREIYHNGRNERLDFAVEDLMKDLRVAVKKEVDKGETFLVFRMDPGDVDDRDKDEFFQKLLPLLNETGLDHDLEDYIKSKDEMDSITLSGWETAPTPEAQVSAEAPTAKTLKDKGYFEKLADSSPKPKKPRPSKKSAGGISGTKKKSETESKPRQDHTVDRHGRD